MDALQSAVIEKEVVSAIAKRFAESGLADLDAVLDMLFVRAEPDDRFAVRKEVFRDFVTREMHTHISDRDFELFLRSNAALNRRKDRIDKADLLDVFQEPFRTERYQYLEREAVLKGRRAVHESLAGAGAPQSTVDRLAQVRADAGGGYADGPPAETLGEAYLRDTLNNRDEAWGVTQKPSTSTRR